MKLLQSRSEISITVYSLLSVCSLLCLLDLLCVQVGTNVAIALHWRALSKEAMSVGRLEGMPSIRVAVTEQIFNEARMEHACH